MSIIWADQALLPTGWARNVRIEIHGGQIQTVTPDATPEGYRTAIALPAPFVLFFFFEGAMQITMPSGLPFMDPIFDVLYEIIY